MLMLNYYKDLDFWSDYITILGQKTVSNFVSWLIRFGEHHPTCNNAGVAIQE